MRFAAIRDPRDIQRCLLQIRDLSLFSTHPCGYSFNAWCFVKMDLGTGQHSSAVHHFLAMYVAMMRGTEIRFKCTRNDCRSLNCFKTHFDVTTLDQGGLSLRLCTFHQANAWQISGRTSMGIPIAPG